MFVLRSGMCLGRSFERNLVGQPNSSFLWIQYMAFHVERADLDRARAVAQRAVDTISFREEEERYNVWVAWVNVEFRFGG